MKKRKIWLALSVITSITCFYMLLSGNSILTKPLLNNYKIPFGTLITWLGFIGLSLSVFLSIKEMRFPKSFVSKLLSYQLKLSLYVSIFWVLISYLLAGNLNFNFSTTNNFQGGQLAMKIFWSINYFLALVPILVFIAYHIINSIKIKKN